MLTPPLPLMSTPPPGQNPVPASSEPKPNGTAVNGARLKTDVQLSGTYLLTVVDDSNERWSRPEWVSWVVTRVACIGILVGGVLILMHHDAHREARLMASILAPAAGYKLIDGLGQAGASNKRHTSKGTATEA